MHSKSVDFSEQVTWDELDQRVAKRILRIKNTIATVPKAIGERRNKEKN